VPLVLYGSFNCPYSFLASLRADRLAAAGDAAVQWRAVVHDPAMPPSGREVCGDLADLLDRELEEIGGLLVPGEHYPARRPALLANTTAAVAGYSALHGPPAGRLRAALFEALWVDGLDVGNRLVLGQLGCPAVSPGETMRRWQAEWVEMDQRMVPMMVLPGGRVFRGLDVLSSLAEMTAAAHRGRQA
jgi:predicted DsbA family dithiol-disulfide isomerase